MLGFDNGVLWDAVLDLEALGRDVYFVIVVMSRSGEVNFVPCAIFLVFVVVFGLGTYIRCQGASYHSTSTPELRSHGSGR